MTARSTHLLRRLCVTSVIATLCVRADDATRQESAATHSSVEFNRDIRPILANNCFKCHGLDERARKAGLRLDVRELATRATELGGTAIVPGNPGASELVRRIFTADADEVMPPPASNKKLTAAEKELLKKWIDQGAEYQPHWSFVLPQRAAPPQVRDERWPRNEIDRFVLARLEAERLRPSPEADRATLIRRVTFDLTGLPPTLAEIDAFLADTSSDAYEKVVDRLLASPRFGERMAVDWLDAARFADTHGYHIDSGRDMTRWREWVINAFNRNLPFDQFTIEQLAGDLLPDATIDQKIASGFNRNHMINYEGGAIPEEYHVAYIVDRVNTTGTVWLGLSVGCAQCHEHKYDPISQKEYYGLYAFFHNVPENGLDGRTGNAAPVLRFPVPEQQQELDRLSAAIKELDQRVSALVREVDAAQADWEREAAADTAKHALPENLAAALAEPAEKRTAKQKTELQNYYREKFAPVVKQRQDQLAKRRKEQADLDKQVATTMVMQEMEKPRETFMLVRGQYDKKGEQVAAGVPASLGQMPDGAPANRLGLARWLVDPSQPLTARVIVNRFWQMYFGTGLVKTAEDFGTQGEWPSHPELLDWLACEFVQPSLHSDAKRSTPNAPPSAWDIKHLQRLIVTSATYRQSSAMTPALVARDSDNRLLARGPRHRLQVEFIRDQALAISGLLNPQLGGASVSPYQPAGIWEELAYRADGKNFTAQEYVQSHGPDLYRRTMYTFIKRTAPPPTLVTFDAPDRETCTVRRARTNTPLQALVLMNDPTYVEAARKLAERMMTEVRGAGGASAGAPDSGPASRENRITFAFRLATARPPTLDELRLLRRVFDDQLAAFRKDPAAATKLLAVGESPRNESLDPAELAAWTIVANVILNLDETVTKG